MAQSLEQEAGQAGRALGSNLALGLRWSRLGLVLGGEAGRATWRWSTLALERVNAGGAVF